VKRLLAIAAIVSTAASINGIALPSPAAAQWLGPHLDAQRYDNLRRHQQRQAERRRQERQGQQQQQQGQQQQQPTTSFTMAQRQEAWSRHKAEYRRIMLQQGMAAADRWLDQQLLAGR
jgi:short subunit dehydrogenase-like uncharacterized protein